MTLAWDRRTSGAQEARGGNEEELAPATTAGDDDDDFLQWYDTPLASSPAWEGFRLVRPFPFLPQLPGASEETRTLLSPFASFRPLLDRPRCVRIDLSFLLSSLVFTFLFHFRISSLAFASYSHTRAQLALCADSETSSSGLDIFKGLFGLHWTLGPIPPSSACQSLHLSHALYFPFGI